MFVYLVSPSYAALDIHGAMCFDLKKLYTIVAVSHYPTAACPEFHVGCGLGYNVSPCPRISDVELGGKVTQHEIR